MSSFLRRVFPHQMIVLEFKAKTKTTQYSAEESPHLYGGECQIFGCNKAEGSKQESLTKFYLF